MLQHLEYVLHVLCDMLWVVWLQADAIHFTLTWWNWKGLVTVRDRWLRSI